MTTLNADTGGDYQVRLIVTNGVQESLPETFIVSIAETGSAASSQPARNASVTPLGLEERDRAFAEFGEL